MAISPREAFRYGFLLRCAEEGLTPEQAEQRASGGLEKLATGDVLSQLVGATKGLGLAGIGAAVLGGGLGGYALGNASTPDTTVEDYKKRELIEAYRLRAELARRRRALAQQMAEKPKPMWGNV